MSKRFSLWFKLHWEANGWRPAQLVNEITVHCPELNLGLSRLGEIMQGAESSHAEQEAIVDGMVRMGAITPDTREKILFPSVPEPRSPHPSQPLHDTAKHILKLLGNPTFTAIAQGQKRLAPQTVMNYCSNILGHGRGTIEQPLEEALLDYFTSSANRSEAEVAALKEAIDTFNQAYKNHDFTATAHLAVNSYTRGHKAGMAGSRR